MGRLGEVSLFYLIFIRNIKNFTCFFGFFVYTIYVLNIWFLHRNVLKYKCLIALKKEKRSLLDYGCKPVKSFSFFVIKVGSELEGHKNTKRVYLLSNQQIFCKVGNSLICTTINMEWRGGTFGYERLITILVDQNASVIMQLKCCNYD